MLAEFGEQETDLCRNFISSPLPVSTLLLRQLHEGAQELVDMANDESRSDLALPRPAAIPRPAPDHPKVQAFELPNPSDRLVPPAPAHPVRPEVRAFSMPRRGRRK